SSMAGLCTPLPTLRLYPRRYLRTARGRCGSLLLHRGGLSPPTPCRFHRRPQNGNLPTAYPTAADLPQRRRPIHALCRSAPDDELGVGPLPNRLPEFRATRGRSRLASCRRTCVLRSCIRWSHGSGGKQELRRGISNAPCFAGEMNFGVGNLSQETSWDISGA